MKRTLFSGIIILSSVHALSALAMPNIGDFIRVEGTVNGKAIAEESLLTSYDSTGQQYEESDTAWQNGVSQGTHTSWVKASGLPSESDIATLLSFCAESGGTPETISVPAGTFNTCRMPANNGKGYVNMGNVPFGTVKYCDDTSDPTSLNVSLVSFRLGQ